MAKLVTTVSHLVTFHVCVYAHRTYYRQMVFIYYRQLTKRFCFLLLSATSLCSPALQAPLVEREDQTAVPSADKYLGEGRGIQGHYNSCYLDSTLFGLFALSDAFDSVFLGVVSEKPGDVIRKAVCDLLAQKVVNPLRKLVWRCKHGSLAVAWF